MPDGEHTPIGVITVGRGGRAAAWTEVVQQSPRLELLCATGTAEEAREALARLPCASVAMALGPHAGGELVTQLAAMRRNAVVQAPLARIPDDPWDGVRVAYGFTTLPGVHWLNRFVSTYEPRRLSIRTSGGPGSSRVGLDVAVPHAIALVAQWFPRARLTGATMRGDRQVAATFDASGVEVSVRVECGDRSLSVVVDGDRASARLDWEPHREIRCMAQDGREQTTESATRPAAERALAQLLGGPVAGPGLAVALAVARLCGDIWATAGSIGVSHRRLRVAASAVARDESVGAVVGLRGAVPAADVAPLVLPSPKAIPVEVRALRVGRARAVFLTVSPEQLPSTLSLLDGLCVETRTRGVSVGAQDCWDDRRDAGQAMIEVFAAAEPARAADLVALQADGDPTANVRPVGALLGYPECCVDAFAEQSDRSNNTYNRYATMARTRTEGPWPWQLNNFAAMTVPFFPCRYDCEAAAAYAEAVAEPGAAANLRGSVLYFTHELQLLLGGVGDTQQVSYTCAAIPLWGDERLMPLARLLAAGDSVRFDDRVLEVHSGPRRLARLFRTDPALGFLASFG